MVRHFVRVAGNLSLSMSELSANIPPFNPQKMMLADAMPGAPAVDDAPDAGNRCRRHVLHARSRRYLRHAQR